MEHKKKRRGRPPRSEIYQRLSEAVDELRERMGGLPSPAEAEGIWTSIWYEEAHHSTALEGNTLVSKQIKALLDEGRAVGNKELREYMEVTGYAEAARWVYGQALEPGGWKTDKPLTLTEVRYVHRLAMGPVWEVAPHPNANPQEKPGSFRQHDIEAFTGGMIPVPWIEVDAEMADWVASLVKIKESDTPVEQMAAAHAAFERTHPFLDGNGRTGRLVLNLLLVRSGYPPAIIYYRDRSRYLNALDKADAGDVGPLGELVARSVIDNLYRFIVPAVAGPQRLVPLAALATKGRQVPALRAAIENGRLRAVKGEDGQWRSTKAWVEAYVESRYKRNR